MNKSKTRCHEQIDMLCKELGISEPQYQANTSIKELESIIDKLEEQLPDEGANSDLDVELPIQQSSDDEHKQAPTSKPSSEMSAESDIDRQSIQVRALKTFRCRVDNERVDVLKSKLKTLPQTVANDAIRAGVAVKVP
ncbi:hypothetical protein [Shewanella surugensis]|uniref:Uncharacterized protein n=1 Tax=Shewanella surugensis TaxID=212020 RepID=A0ABT0L8X4_9GAMM|nr:hypothetical protein [Shewanella surugensis]MCL1124156.1 hypothetical protein [Shewanella surugensis]